MTDISALVLGGLFILTSCVGGSWLIARLGWVKVRGITPEKSDD